ncbi:MAG: DUF559 domain-containing protein [Acidimicrobiia bacterium]|nr:DUF559 domain-containing protein [Acidimicrobiia bacterium]
MYLLTEITSDQLGLITRRQLRELGFRRARIARMIERGELVTLHSKVYALAGSVDSAHRRVLACVLETGLDAVASHTTAAWLWGIGGYSASPIHTVVSRESRHHQHLDWTVHQFTGLPPHHRTVLDDVPVTSPALTMLHLAQLVSTQRLAVAVDRAWSLRLLTGRDLLELDEELAIQGRNGIRKLRDVAKARGANWVPPESGLETRFMQLLGGVPGLRRQVNIGDGTWNARVDFLHESSGTVIEIQSERYHAALTDREADRIRRARLEAAGYRVIEVWDTELFTDPGGVVDRVLNTIRRSA